MKRFFRNNGLSLVLLGAFLVLLVGQVISGFHEYNSERREHHQTAIALSAYLGSGHFWEALFENWESEFLQMASYVFLTAFLIQKGSAESKDPDRSEPAKDDPTRHRDNPYAPGPVRRGGWRLKLYEHSLSLALALLFLISFVGHIFAGSRLHNESRLEHGEMAVSWKDYLGSAEFWFQSFQNWQSEFLAVLAIVVLSIWLREKGSPESKSVTSPHARTGK
jgi:membrane protein implicated in regulation of membrane protease activity